MALKKLRNTLSSIKNFPSYPGIIMPDNLAWLGLYDKVSTTLNRKEYEYRKKLVNHIPTQKTHHTIEDNNGFLIADMSESQILQAALHYVKNVVASIDWEEKANSSKKAFLINHKIDIHSPENLVLLQLAMSPEILKPIAEYLGTFPILSSAAIWYSPNKNPEPKGSQLYHLDGEDIKQVKCFIPIEEITPDSGPLTILPASVSDDIYNELLSEGKLNRRNTKIEDDIIYTKTTEDKSIKVTGKPGTVAFVDTCRCYHYGSRAAQRPRVLLHLHYYSAFSKMMPLWGRTEKSVPSSEAINAEMARALIAKSHLTFSNARNSKK